MKRFLLDWLPLALWTAIILRASGSTFSGTHTGSLIERIFAVAGVHLSITADEILNTIVRKLAHLTEYAILGALAFRAVRSNRAGWLLAWSVAAVAIAIAVASTDEYLQSFSPARTSRVSDIVLDATGATIAQLVIRKKMTAER